MKILCSAFLAFLFVLSAAPVLADLSAKPNVIVLQKKWRMQVHNIALNHDEVEIQKQREQEERARKDRERQNEKLIEQGMPTSPVPVRKPTIRMRGLSVVYFYEVKIRNTGKKDIRTLTWDYVFFDPTTGRELGRRRFVSKVRIGSAKTRNVVGRSSFSPTGTIDATRAGKESPDLYSENVIIQSIGYADGSVWTAASK